jgi:hypothetical protein
LNPHEELPSTVFETVASAGSATSATGTNASIPKVEPFVK